MNEQVGNPPDPLFPTRRGCSLSRDALERLLTKYVTRAARTHPTLVGKKITPHALRHYVDGWVMWPVRVFPLAGVPRGPVPAT